MEIRGQSQIVPINSIKPNPWNPNEQSDFIFERELTSIKTHGFLDPILVREVDGGLEIIDGEHRWIAANQLKFEKVPVHNIGKVDDATAKKLTIILNEVKGKPDDNLLAGLLLELSKTIALPDLSKELPYSEEELKHMIANNNVDWSAIEAGLKPLDQDEEGWKTFSIRLPEAVHDNLTEQIKRFKRICFQDQKDVADNLIFEAMLCAIITVPDDHINP